MIIRRVNMETDVDGVIRGMKDFISRMNYHDFLPNNYDELLDVFNQIVLRDDVFEVLVAEHNDTIVGGIGMLYAASLWDRKEFTAEELFWWVDNSAPTTTALRLLRTATNNAVSRGCKFLTFKSLMSSPESLDKVYKRMGLKPIEVTYMGVIS